MERPGADSRRQHRWALDDCRSILTCARYLDDPVVIVQLIRLAFVHSGVGSVERALSAGQCKDGELAALQTLFAEEAAYPRLLVAARGERGALHWTLTAVGAGDFDLTKLAAYSGPEVKEKLARVPHGLAFRPFHAMVLREMTPGSKSLASLCMSSAILSSAGIEKAGRILAKTHFSWNSMPDR